MKTYPRAKKTATKATAKRFVRNVKKNDASYMRQYGDKGYKSSNGVGVGK